MVKEINMEVLLLFNRILSLSEQQGNDEDGVGVIVDRSLAGIHRIKPKEQLINLPLRPVNHDRHWNQDFPKAPP